MVQRRGYSEWVKLIEEFEKSASSLEDFAAKLGVKPSTLQFWFYKLRKRFSSVAFPSGQRSSVGRAEGAAGSDRDGIAFGISRHASRSLHGGAGNYESP